MDAVTENKAGLAAVSPDEANEIVAELRASKEVYGLLSRLFFSPLTQEEVDSLAALERKDGESSLRAMDCEGAKAMSECLRGSSATLRQDLNIDFTSAFYGANQYEGKVATPYESVFRSEDGLLFQKPYTEVYQAYKKNCLKTDPNLNLPADHLSFELQFLAKLCDKAADALEAEDLEECRTMLQEQQNFIREHILSWIDDLSDVASRLVKLDFYRGVIGLTKSFAEDRMRMADEFKEALND